MTARAKRIIERVLDEASKTSTSFRSVTARFWSEYLGDYRRRIIVALVLTALLGAHPFAFALTLRFLVDHVLEYEEGFPRDKLDFHLKLLGIYFGINMTIWGVYLVSSWTRSWMIARMGQDIVYRLRERLNAKLQALHVGYYERTAAGKILSRVLDDVRVIHQWITTQLVHMGTHGFQIVIGVGVVMHLDLMLGTVVLAVLPLYGIVFYLMRPAIRQTNMAMRAMNSRMYARTSEKISGIHVVKAFGRERREIREFAHLVFDSVRLHMRQVNLQQWLVLLSVLISSVATGWITYVAITYVKVERMSVGSAVAFIGALAALMNPVRGFTARLSAMQVVLVALKRVFALLDEPEQVRGGHIHLSGMVGKIEFENVTFSYPGQKTPALKNVSFRVNPGERIGIIGPSGAGKSTVFQLLLRFYDADSGSIRVGGVDIREADLSSLRRHVCMVQQEPVVFSGTIAENITYGSRDPSPAGIIATAREAEIHDFIMSLPQKYETEVGEQGVTLSGGQKQRLALATALLSNPEVLLLDDTTSALDAATEAKIRKTLNNVMRGRTSITVAQRIAAVREADRVIVIQSGEISQQGAHDELKATDGFYAEMCRQQETVVE